MPYTPSTTPEAARRVACIGAGVIGGGWVAHFLARGYDVTAWDPADDAEEKLRRLVSAAWPALEQLGLAEGASQDRLTVVPTLAEAVADAHFVQESAPEKLELKRSLLAELDAATPPGVVIASSTSGYPMTDMQTEAADPSRLVVGHPFNPPYLIPLVEVVGGTHTAPEAVTWASRFYDLAGKSVITMDRELPGFIANRLQEALWREALHMVANGEATVEDIDASITEGPGLRWAFMGPCLTFALAGGEGGMAHMLDHFGPSLKSPWTRLEAPELDRELRDAMVDGCATAAGDRTYADLVAERDQGVINVLRATGRLPHQAPRPTTHPNNHATHNSSDGATGSHDSDGSNGHAGLDAHAAPSSHTGLGIHAVPDSHAVLGIHAVPSSHAGLDTHAAPSSHISLDTHAVPNGHADPAAHTAPAVRTEPDNQTGPNTPGSPV